MNGEWCYFRSQFTPEECELIFSSGMQIPPKKAAIGVEGNSVNESYRKSDIRFIEKQNASFEWLFDRMWKLAIRANDEWFNFHISKLDYMQLAEYNSKDQGEYKTHHDVFWLNNDPKYHRKLTAIIQLTDPSTYEGGNFELFTDQKPNPGEIREQGSVIFIPSFLEHRATPVIAGVRHSIACWFDGPKWK